MKYYEFINIPSVGVKNLKCVKITKLLLMSLNPEKMHSLVKDI